MRRSAQAANWEIAVLALYHLGGSHRRFHTEEIAVSCYELAPGQFAWRTRKDFIDCDTARVALADAEKAKNGLLVSMEGDSQREGMWMLTAAGVEWVRAHKGKLSPSDAKPKPGLPRQYQDRQLYATTRHSAFLKFSASGSCESVQDYEFAESLRCTVNSTAATLRARLEEVRAQAAEADREDVLRYLATCEKKFSEMLA